MKKLLSLVLVVTLFAAGCGKKDQQVVCTSDATNNGMTIIQKYILDYAGEGISFIEVDKSYAFDKDEDFESFGTVIDNTITTMKESENEYIKFESSKKGRKYTTKLTVDMNKATTEELTKLGLNKNLEEFRTTLKDQGLSCK